MSLSLKAFAIYMLLALTAFGVSALPSAEAAKYGVLNGQAPSALASVQDAPINIAPPLLSGLPIAGETLTASNGEWQGEPSAFAYQWLHCRNGVRGSKVFSCTPIPGANSAQYALTASDLWLFVAVEVTATNAFGSSAARSAVSKPVVPPHATLTVHPPKRTANTRAKFAFTADAADVSFKCKLDKRPFQHCRSPFVVNLKRGPHAFRVVAVGPGGAEVTAPVAQAELFRWRIS